LRVLSALGLLASILLGAGAAASAPVPGGQRFEAEQLAVPPGAGGVVKDTSAGGGRALALGGRGTAHGSVRVLARSRLTLVVRGERCGGAAPRLRVAVDGRRVLSRAVSARRWTTMAAPGTVAAGRRRLALALVNPHRTSGCVRRLRVDRLVFVPAAAGPPAGSRWVPAPRTTWQWQLTTPVDTSVAADMYDIDLFDNSAAVVAGLHAQGRHVVCYLDAGTFEPGRPDAGSFPASVIGKELPDWPGEHWLDVRRLDVLGPIIKARMDLCRQKGFDGVEPDNVDAYANDSGFPLTADDQLRFNRFLADAAHARGLSVGLKNDLDQVAVLQPAFDWALNEQCSQYSECNRLQPFVRAGKAVFEAEYELATDAFCPQAEAAGLMAMRKHSSLDAFREPCWH
jgi:hypothetical protein